MPESFIDEVIEMEYDEENLRPRAFVWRGARIPVLEVVSSWQDWGFSHTGSKKKTWRNRRHRNYYVVRTSEGEFELYLDRGLGKREWVLLKKRNPTGG